MIRLEEAAKGYEGGFRTLGTPENWDRISEAYRAEIFRRAEEYARQPYPMRKATDFLAFVRNGSRQADEGPYFFRRKKLCWEATACRMGREEMLDDVVDGIWCICEESSWVISAHNVNPIPGAPAPAEYPLPEVSRPYIDLFSAQTGMILTLVRQMLGEALDRVSPALCLRISREIRQRILEPFLAHHDFWWMGFIRKDLCNWTPWIVSNVLCCAMREPMAEAERRETVIRACGMLDRWLEVVPEDGGCDEGAGYWNMAGGALLDCLELLEEATEGRLSFWQEEKIRNILAFPGKAEIGEGYFLNFADCDVKPFLSGERIQTAGEKTGDPALCSLGNRLRQNVSAEMDDVPHYSRLLRLLFHAPAEGAAFRPDSDIWFPDLQVRIARRGPWTLAAKGGHNGESHNHNDVGSFMLYLDGAPEIVDAGNMTYTAKTFSDRRYELWNTRSAYHNVPMIGGREQLAGTERRAEKTAWLPEGLELEMRGAYDPAAGIRTCMRRMELREEGLRLTDRIETETPEEVCWVFLFRNRPERTARGMETERMLLGLPEGWETETEEIPVTDARMGRNWPGSLWRVKIRDRQAREHRAEWVFTRKE